MQTKTLFTFRRGKKIKERVIRNCFGHSTNCPTSLVFLFLFNGFQSDILPFFPIYLAPSKQREKEKSPITINILLSTAKTFPNK